MDALMEEEKQKNLVLQSLLAQSRKIISDLEALQNKDDQAMGTSIMNGGFQIITDYQQ